MSQAARGAAAGAAAAPAAAPAAQGSTKLSMPTFNGKKEDLKAFISLFQIWAEVGNLSDAKTAEAAGFALRDEAATWFQNMKDRGEAASTSWTELKTALNERFKSAPATGELARLLDSLVQGKNESVAAFVDRIHKVQFMVNEVNKKAGGVAANLEAADQLGIHDDQFRMQFLRGMKKSYRKIVVTTPNLTTLKDYIKAAECAETAEKDSQQEARVEEVDGQQDEEDVYVFYQTNRGFNRGRGRAPFRGRQRGRGRGAGAPNPQCYVCEQYGHISLCCPSSPFAAAARRGQQQQQQQPRQGQPQWRSQPFRGRGQFQRGQQGFRGQPSFQGQGQGQRRINEVEYDEQGTYDDVEGLDQGFVDNAQDFQEHQDFSK